VVIVQSDHLNPTSPHTIVVPFTSKIRRAILPSHVLVPAGVGGLTYASVALCEQLRVVDQVQIGKVLGTLDAPYLDEIAKAIRRTLDL
jgi:mRNA interferase MazF